MADVVCTNPQCPEHDIVKDNSFDYPVDEIMCGACGGPVEATGSPAP